MIEEPPVQKPDILDELPLLNVPRARVEPEKEPEESDRESEVSAESAAVEFETEELVEDIKPNLDVPATEEEAVGVVDLLRSKLPAREHRPPPW